MITDVFPALALGFTETGEDVLSRPPRTSEEGFLNPTAWREIGTYALVICVVILAGAYLAQGLLDYSTQDNNNLTFYTLLSAQLWHVFSLPNAESSLFNNTVTKNKYVWLAILLCLGLTVVAYAITNVRDMLKLEPITNWLTVIIPLLLGATPVLIIRLLKKVGLL
jgi:Ca2+-transporting ATPase